MTYYVIRFWWGGDPDEPNATSSLTLRDIHEIQHSWKPLYADACNYGMELFKRLFRKDPETKTYFKKLRNLDEDQLSQNKQFQAHVINFMSAFNMAILNLKDPEIVIAMMNKLGESHNRIHLKAKHFKALKEVLFEFLKNDLKLSKSKIESWLRYIDFTYRHIITELEEE